MTATANTFRYQYGEVQQATVPFKSGVAVSIGDLSYIDAGDSNTLKPAMSATWESAIATPSAPTVADTAVALDASGLANSATGVKITYQFPWGEGALSAAGTATPTLHAGIYVSGTPLVPPAPALYTNIYVETSAGSGIYKLWGITYGSPVIVYSYGAGQVPFAANPGGVVVASAALDYSQYNFCQSFLGVAMQGYDGTNANAYGIKDGFLRVATTGVFQFPLVSASYAAGDYFGCAKDTGNNLAGQTVIAVASPLLAIGRAVRPGTSQTIVDLALLTSKLALVP